jgi:hypothetical protein
MRDKEIDKSADSDSFTSFYSRHYLYINLTVMLHGR